MQERLESNKPDFHRKEIAIGNNRNENKRTDPRTDPSHEIASEFNSGHIEDRGVARDTRVGKHFFLQRR